MLLQYQEDVMYVNYVIREFTKYYKLSKESITFIFIINDDLINVFCLCTMINIYMQVMESCVKNCGKLVHEEVATRAFMEELRELVKGTGDENIKAKSLEMIQNWGMAFRTSQKYRIVTVSPQSPQFISISDEWRRMRYVILILFDTLNVLKKVELCPFFTSDKLFLKMFLK